MLIEIKSPGDSISREHNVCKCNVYSQYVQCIIYIFIANVTKIDRYTVNMMPPVSYNVNVNWYAAIEIITPRRHSNGEHNTLCNLLYVVLVILIHFTFTV